MLTRKHTAWRKNRKLGDVMGGRRHPKVNDRVWARVHSLTPPAPHDPTPQVIHENPSRLFFFPVTPAEVLASLQRLPPEHVATLTHIWFRRVDRAEYVKRARPLAEFLCGSNVRVVVLYPWPRNLAQRIGVTKPTKRELAHYARWTSDLRCTRGVWHLHWQLEELRHFYLDYLLVHEVGHNNDWFQSHWSKANVRSREASAVGYALRWLSSGRTETSVHRA
jgi:hypothetical protein